MRNVFSTKKPPRLSKEGLEAAKNKLQNLRALRLEQINSLRTLKEQQSDNFSLEDSSYIEAVDKLRSLEVEIEKTTNIVAKAKILKAKRRPEKVGLGSKVKLKAYNQEVEYTIVQTFEADPSCGKISDESPLGRQLLGKRIRDYIILKNLRSKKDIAFRLVRIS